MQVRSVDASAARDALDAGVDLLVTADPTVVSYAARRNEYQSLQLPWDHTYVVLATENTAPDANNNFRLTLAELVADAVRADSRIPERPFWWEVTDQCPVVATASRHGSRSSRVVYPSDDRVAQDLAERLVALAGSRSARGVDSVLNAVPGLLRDGDRVTAAAIAPRAFAEALRAGGDLAYVLPLGRTAAVPCEARERLLRAVPWVQSIVPLLDIRKSILVRRDRVGIRVSLDGSVHILAGPVAKP
ncbi:MAG: hypothetical protein AB1762_02335, partial [Gemmatimonadota bacterium]